MIRTVLALAWIVILGGCRCGKIGAVNPAMRVTVQRQDSAYIFRFDYCSDPRTTSDIYAVRIVPHGPPERADEIPPHCEIKWTGGAALIEGQWRYGRVPSGFSMTTCKPLEPSHKYDVYINSTGYATFEILANGEVKLEGQSCP
jgi:hypothetical protein